MFATRFLNDSVERNRIHVAENGLEALALLRGSDTIPKVAMPCIVLLDLNMPKMNGFELLDELKADETLASIVTFVLSTSSDPVDIRACYEKGAAGFMSKETIAQDFKLLVDFLSVFERLVTFCPDISSAVLCPEGLEYSGR